MTDPSSHAPPGWVHKRDGRQVPFEADKISRALFAASEGLGHPDAFLARELADGVVHFLTAENDGTTPTTEQIGELVIKVVRELGQPALAERFAAHSLRRQRSDMRTETGERPGRVTPGGPKEPGGEIVVRFAPDATLPEFVARCLRSYTLQSVFTRDLVAAQTDGLLTLTGLETPGGLAGCVLGPQSGEGARPLIAVLEEMRRFAGGFLALDGPDYLLAREERVSERAVSEFAQELRVGLRLTGLHGIVNLNSAGPPSWADDLAEGPLFAGHRRAPHGENIGLVADLLLSTLLRKESSHGGLRIDWHLSERDFRPDSGARERLQHLTRLALDGNPLSFVFDRPRQPVHLAEGVDRQHPAVLLTVGLHLPRFASLPGMDGDPTLFLQRLGSLARLALSAAVQKRDYLRRQERIRREVTSEGAGVTSGFLLDRARMVVAVVGLDWVVHHFMKRSLANGGAALDFARQIVMRLRDVLRQDGRATHLDTSLDGPFGFRLDNSSPGEWPAPESVAGLTPWEPAAPVKSQLRAAGILHGVADSGTLALSVSNALPPTAELIADSLQTAWRQTEVVRLRVVRARQSPRQLTFAG